MDLTPIWGSLIVFLVCPLLGAVPLIDWITYALTGRQLRKLGTGNVSVSAAFYHGGRLTGICAVLSEAAKGILAVLLTRLFFPGGSVWEILAIIALVMGRYWMGKGAGTTNAVWGIAAHDLVAAALVWLISLIGFTIIRDRQWGKYSALMLLVAIIGLRHPHQLEYTGATLALACLLAWIYQNIPDDLDLAKEQGNTSTNKMFRFFQGDKNIVTLEHKLDALVVGAKAANLSQLKQQGYEIPQGWVLAPGEDLRSLVENLEPTPTNPLVVRSSAIGEDSLTASSAGQYISVLNVTSREQLQEAILDCQASYLQANARDYRRQQGQKETAMAILVQQQIKGQYSGVAFSRDPLEQFTGDVAIEALPGAATKIVSGQFSPQRYQVSLPEADQATSELTTDGVTSQGITVKQLDKNADSAAIPLEIIKSVALMARELEELYEGVPQDIEWTHDGEQLWLLQARPISTMQPLWTRRIAAEVIPGKIRPLTWSINRPLTCGIWGRLFTIVLGDRAKDLNFMETATLHFGSAYFNVTLLGKIFRRMGLPPESLEFLTRGAKFTKPSLKATLRNAPGLWRLAGREWQLVQHFQREQQQLFQPLLTSFAEQEVTQLTNAELLERINTILSLLERATYYNILSPLSLALRQSILKVSAEELDQSQVPEVAAVNSLAAIAAETRKLLATEQITLDSSASLFAHIAENPEGTSIMERFNLWLEQYGYLSQGATDIAVPRWQDRPSIPRQMFTRFYFDLRGCHIAPPVNHQSWQAKVVQQRLNLKSQVSDVYDKLLAHLRWSFLAIAKQFQMLDLITAEDEIFLLKFAEIVELISLPEAGLQKQFCTELLETRQAQWEKANQLATIPSIVYGQPKFPPQQMTEALTQKQFKGLGTSPGQLEGTIKIVSSLEQAGEINRQTILVVPYTDAGWSPLLAQAGGLIAEVGGRLSHGAIIAREYQIPAVMDLAGATKIFQDGQRVKLNGQTGIIEVMEQQPSDLSV